MASLSIFTAQNSDVTKDLRFIYKPSVMSLINAFHRPSDYMPFSEYGKCHIVSFE